MNELMERMERMEQASRAAEQARQAAERRTRRWQFGTGALVGLGLVMLPLQSGTAQGNKAQAGGLPALENRVAALQAQNITQATQIAELQNRLAHFTRVGNDLFITGANLHLRNGLGATNGNPATPLAGTLESTAVNGLGNLIVGYNESRALLPDVPPPPPDARFGSHNIVVGAFQNFTRYGGFVAGAINTVSGPYASVSGGAGNVASGDIAAVSGGSKNTASGNVSSVSGGEQNVASGIVAWAGGGLLGTASGGHASVSGGLFNMATGLNASVSGGELNTASGDLAAVGGGSNVVQSVHRGWAAGSEAPGAPIVGDFRSP